MFKNFMVIKVYLFNGKIFNSWEGLLICLLWKIINLCKNWENNGVRWRLLGVK